MLVGLTAVAVLTGAGLCGPAARPARHPTTSTAALPAPDHVVVVVEENHSYSDVIGSPQAPYLNGLAVQGASFTNSFAVTHPSEPNYLALFAGSTFGLGSDACPVTESADNLGSELIAAGRTFAGYSESQPSVGYPGCTSGDYARKHVPWIDFGTVPGADSLPFTSFPTDYDSLPPVSFVIPDLRDDMHDGTISQGDSWLQNNLGGYQQWAATHNSVLIVTWDEDDYSQDNQIPTIFYGQPVRPGSYSEQIDHYSVLRTLEDLYGLPYAGASASAAPIIDCWN